MRRLIAIGPTPPPTHGVSIATERLVAALDRMGALAAHLDTRDPRPVTTLGVLDLRNVALGVWHALLLARLLLRHRDAGVHVPISQERWGFLRDAVFIWLAKLARRRVYVHLHGGHFDAFHAGSGRAMRLAIRATLRGAHQAWVLTDTLRGVFGDLVPANRVHVVENVVEDLGVRRNGGPPAGAAGVRLLCLANLVPGKGAVEVLDAVEALGEEARGWVVRLVGEGDPDVVEPLRRRGERLEREHGVRVELPGTATGDAKVAEFARADVFVYPSTYRFEGQPLVLLEALAAGLPIVTTRHAGIPDTVRDGRDGILVPPGDVDALVDALRRVVQDAALRSRLRQAARARYEAQYRPERLVTDLRRLLAE